jgi:hypothetical protein
MYVGAGYTSRSRSLSGAISVDWGENQRQDSPLGVVEADNRLSIRAHCPCGQRLRHLGNYDGRVRPRGEEYEANLSALNQLS